MKSSDELERARKIIFEKYTTTTKTGKKSTVKAQHLWQFLAICFGNKLDFLKEIDPKPTKKKLKELKELGFDEQYLNKWQKISQDEKEPKEQIVIVLKNS